MSFEGIFRNLGKGLAGHLKTGSGSLWKRFKDFWGDNMRRI